MDKNKIITMYKDDIYALMFLEFLACSLLFGMFVTAKITKDFPILRGIFIFAEFYGIIQILADIKQWLTDAEVE